MASVCFLPSISLAHLLNEHSNAGSNWHLHVLVCLAQHCHIAFAQHCHIAFAPPLLLSLRCVPHTLPPDRLPANTHRYIQWAELNGVNGGIHIDLKGIFERCTYTFRTYDQYKEDERYLKICIKYADKCDDPRDTFEFLEHWKIGTQNPLLYTAWAMVLESMGVIKEAERVFETGSLLR